ncbi:MAG: cytochrome c oxidase subunit 3 [Gammaproteobacteria bacterium]|nr:cytochrome c oxidase subunit 3 [Gammaproteobacteria bacterium]NIR82205.1 cytochrome c oxidase subunit 3 [Gammaproteobacteria bacterium]NIR90804.1 cytochrome c oxidase subunit 3 [Gammaproteobacteria bacterium]NIU03355.1 cytochrome c oxidase subunit 3 [Gammaproteobacteria bacterium]NIV50851.1 cytochrome c oxidase subunit 3 [Gammaproteobacteria bacterium]
MAEAHGGYYLPHGTRWPILGSIGLTSLLVGFATMLNGAAVGPTLMVVGLIILALMMFGWFGTVIRESESGTYNDQVDRSFRWGMGWFIFSEVMFFGAFFGALYYARVYAVPWLGGEGVELGTHELLWPGYESAWPTNGPASIGGRFTAMAAWGVPALNTLILLSSGVTVTLAHWALKGERRGQLIGWLAATIALGFLFVGLQASEYIHAYTELGLTLGSGIYGSTFFMLTGFHGAHVTIGAIMLTVMLLRAIVGHFTADRHFAFEAAAWYWHFVDVVWLGLFTFVYWL